jgi:hypothetical protein
MRQFTTLALLLLFCAAAVFAQDATAPASIPSDQNGVAQMLIQREQDSWAHRKAGDAAYFAQGVPVDFRSEMPGDTVVKQTDLPNHTRFSPMENYNLSNFNVTFPAADRANVTYTASYTLLGPDAVPLHATRIVTSTWERRDGDWENVNAVFRKP